jgi:hypothetical protein
VISSYRTPSSATQRPRYSREAQISDQVMSRPASRRLPMVLLRAP